MGYLLRILVFLITVFIGFLSIYFTLVFFTNPIILVLNFLMLVLLDIVISNYGCKYKVIENKLYLSFLGKNVYTFPLEKVAKIEVQPIFATPFFAKTVRFGAGFVNVLLCVKDGTIYILPIANFRSIKHDLKMST